MSPDRPSLPGALVAALESQWRALTGSRGSGRLSAAELDAAARALLRLQRGLTGDRELVGAAYMDSGESLGAYLLYYWPASFLQASRALERAYAVPGRPGKPGRALDIGAGPGPASAACALRGASSVLALDASKRALAVAERILEGGPARFETREWNAGDGLDAGSYDLVVLSHSLNELFHGRGDRIGARAAFLESLAPGLTPGGFILVVEPALLSTSRDLIAVRDLLRLRGWTIDAPCLFSGPCPAFASGDAQTCHDAFEWEPPYFAREIAARAGLDRPELKLAWFALRPPGESAAAAPGSEVLLVVSDPMLNKAGRTRYMVCGAGGRVSLSAKLSELPPECASFAGLRRGMRIRLSGAEARGENGMGLKAGSLLEIIG